MNENDAWTNVVYTLMISLFFTHEIDAAFRHEWRVLPITSFLSDDIGREVFIWLHVPIFVALLLFHYREDVRVGISMFAIIHVGLHWIFRNHPFYEFNNISSSLLIAATGVLGGIYLLLFARSKRSKKLLSVEKRRE
jgi:hypothetical protein